MSHTSLAWPPQSKPLCPLHSRNGNHPLAASRHHWLACPARWTMLAATCLKTTPSSVHTTSIIANHHAAKLPNLDLAGLLASLLSSPPPAHIDIHSIAAFDPPYISPDITWSASATNPHHHAKLRSQFFNCFWDCIHHFYLVFVRNVLGPNFPKASPRVTNALCFLVSESHIALLIPSCEPHGKTISLLYIHAHTYWPAMAYALRRSRSSAIESLTPLPLGSEIQGFSLPMTLRTR